MAKYNEDYIVNEVKIILTENENAPMLETEGMDDIALERDTLIRHLIPGAINRVLEVAPDRMLKDVSELYAIDNSKIKACKHKIIVPIRDNVMKILSVKVDGWHRQLHAFLTDESEEYELLHCRYPSWTPTRINPIGFIVDNLEEDEEPDADASGTGAKGYAKMLELKPGTDAKEDKVRLKVICKCSGADEDGEYLVPRDCKDALIYMIAGMYYTSVKETQMAQTMTAMAVDMLGGAAKAAEESE